MFRSDTIGERPCTEPLPPAAAQVPDFVVVDVETSCSSASSICQIGIVGFCDGRVTFEYETLVDPRDRFSGFNTRIHGITAERVIGEPCFADVHAVVDGHLAGRTTVAHSYFDKGALGAACRRHHRPAIETTWLDSVCVAKRAWPGLPSHRLNVLSAHLGIPHRHHDALSDARAAGFVIVRAIEHTGMSLSDWLAPSIRRNAGLAPRPSAVGPLRGQRVAILGEPRGGPLAHRIAALGGRVVSSVGSTTTILAIVGERPFGYGVRTDLDFRRAEGMNEAGGPIRIMEARRLLSEAAG